MSRLANTAVFLVLMLALLALSVDAKTREISKTFDAKEYVKINTVSGDCTIREGEPGKITVNVFSAVRPYENFEPEFSERTNSLVLKENMYGSCSGESRWEVTVPKGTRVKFSTASGNFTVEDMDGDFRAETASGDIEVHRCTGEFNISTASGDMAFTYSQGEIELSTASGEIEMQDCRGFFTVSTASGDIDATGVTLDGSSSFTTASGAAQVVVASTPEYNLKVSTASGRATLDYNGNALKGNFEMIAKVRSGRIDCPFDFDNVEHFRRWGDEYVSKSFTRDTDSPDILVTTASGKATLRD